jgi:hypothetical protein
MKSEIDSSGQKFRPIKTLNPEQVLKAIKGIPDVLTQETKDEQQYLKNLVCMVCGKRNITNIPLVIDGKPVFGEYLPKNIRRCLDCNSEFEPYTKVIVK